MPTGYTSILEERDVSFEEFVWRCARAFGAFVYMRDSSLDAKIPTQMIPSDYHKEQIAKYEQQIKEIQALSAEDAEVEAQVEYLKLKDEHDAMVYHSQVCQRRILALIEQINLWKPPTPDHEGLKRFMLEQLNGVLKEDDYAKWQPKRQIGDEWRQERLESLRDNVEFAAESRDELQESLDKANRWIAALDNSVPLPKQMSARPNTFKAW